MRRHANKVASNMMTSGGMRKLDTQILTPVASEVNSARAGKQKQMKFGSILMGQIGMEKQEKIKCVEQLGWWDPDVDTKISIPKTTQWLK